MDIHPDIAKWLREMGYSGQIPENLVGMCNNSTKFIWEQLMQNIRPKQEVETIKRNIIFNRLKTKPLNKQDDFLYKVKEIEQYKQKLAVEEKLNAIDEMVQEKRYKVDQLAQTCKMKDVSLDFLKNKIKENEQRKYLLDAKKKQLELQNVQAEETLTKLKNVTPVEREESSTGKEITKILEECAQKLNNMLVANQKLRAQKFHRPVNSVTIIKKNSPHNQSSVATYLSMQEKENFEEITRSCRKEAKDKENVDSNIQIGSHKNVKNSLFGVPRIIIEDTEKDSFEHLGVDTLPLDEISDRENNPAVPRRNKRESLGLLPDSCLDEVDNNESFLQASDKSQESTVLSGRSNHSDDSVVFNFKTPEKRGLKKAAKSSADAKPVDLHSNMAVNRELEKLLHANNRELIHEMLQKCIRNVKVEFTKIISVEKDGGDGKNKVSEDDIAKLRFIHIQTELKILQQKKSLKDLVAQINRRKIQMLSSIKSGENLIELQDRLDANIKRVALDASLAAIKKEINSSKVEESDDNDLQILLSRIAKIKKEIASKMHLIQLTMDELYVLQRCIATTKESVMNTIWHVTMFKTNTDWMNVLLEGAWSEEMRVFESFPLEYQRRCIHTEPRTFYRELCIDNYPRDTQLGASELQMIGDILESPFLPPETVLLNVIKAKIKMQVLKSMGTRSSRYSFAAASPKRKYSLEDLRRQESYLEFAIDRLKSLIFSSNAARTLSVGEVVKQAMDIWTEMPMKDFISEKRLFEGKGYQFYQSRLNGFL